MSFVDLGLSEPLLRAIDQLGYITPTPIQAKAIPIIQMGRDVIGVAQTGTGKTASFTLPMIDALSGGRTKARMPRSLILSPTRELAAQIAENFDQFTIHLPLSKALLIGGENMAEQISAVDRGVDVLIATPGRLLDLFERGKILLNDIKIFVIDEADRMLDMGFIPDIEKIGSFLPPLRQTLLFSATMPPEIKRLAEKFLSNPKEVAVAPPATTATTVTQYLCNTTDMLKRQVLRHILRKAGLDTPKGQNAMIFCNRKRDVDVVAESLNRHGFSAAALHGDLPQPVRMERLDKFRNNDISIMVCSDVAARGLDIKGVSHVVNFDVPFNAEDYVHRIGRTGRAGATGTAFTLSTADDVTLVSAITSLIGKDIPALPADWLADFVPAENYGASNKRGGRVDKFRHKNRAEKTARGSRFGKPRTPVYETADDPADLPGPAKGFGDDLPDFLRR